jgi:hypothetical protein
MLAMSQFYANHPDVHKGSNSIIKYSDIEFSSSYFEVETRKINEIINILKLFRM